MSDYMFMLESHLTGEQYRVVGQVQAAAHDAGLNVFLTGGAMRDILGGFPVRDLDFTVEGNPAKIVKALVKAGAVAVMIAMASSGPVSAQELSEASVRTLMDYAWSLTPDRFTKPDGGVIEVDRNSRAKVEVPLDAAREVVKAGRLTAHAQTCDLKDEHIANHRVFMASERDKNKWTEQQMLYMNQLHLVTVMLLTGKLKVVETDGNKEVSVEENAKTDAKSCTEEQRVKVREAIATFIKAHPQQAPQAFSAGAAPPAAGGPVPPATPASAKAAPAAKK